jgi:subtilisin family serine protease
MNKYGKQDRTRARSADLDERIIRIPPYKNEDAAPRDKKRSPHLTWPDLPDLWNQTTGKGIKVAVLDTGIDVEHPALEPNIKCRKNFTGGPVDNVSDEEGHGTMVAGIVAAHRSFATVNGVAPDAGLFIGKVLQQADGGAVRNLKRGIEWAVKKGVDIINISLGSDGQLCEIHEEIIAASKAGIFVVCAAGNDGNDGLDFPAKYPECIAVGALNRLLNERWEENSGVGSAIGEELDIMALGEEVLSTFPFHLDKDGVSVKSGTSLAAPYITGVLALALAKLRKPGGAKIIERSQLRDHLLRSVIDLGPAKFDTSFGNGAIAPIAFLNGI